MNPDTPTGDDEQVHCVKDVYGFEVEVDVENYYKQEKKRLLKEEEYAKKWEVLFLKYKRKDDELFNSSSFKKLVEKGIPIQYRGFVWYTFSGAAARAHRANTLGSDILDPSHQSLVPLPSSSTEAKNDFNRPKKGSRMLKVTYYQDLQRQLRNLTTGSRRIAAAVEIEKDLRRTFPGHTLFESEEGKSMLRRILLAYALRNPSVGYCQSMNVLAAFILLVTEPARQHQYHNAPSNLPTSVPTASPGSVGNVVHQEVTNSTNISIASPSNDAQKLQHQSDPEYQYQAQNENDNEIQAEQPYQKKAMLPIHLAEQWEERAFWILVEMVEGRCVDYYTRTLRGSQVDLRVLSEVLASHLPALTAHFDKLGLSLPLLSTRWFMCAFALVLPAHTALHIWDQILVHSQLSGNNTNSNVPRDYIVLFATALLQRAQDTILQKGEGEAGVSDIVLLLDRVPQVLYDKKDLIRHYKSILFRLPPGGELMTRMRNSATEHVDTETTDIKRARDLMQASRQTKFNSVELSQIHALLLRFSPTRSEHGSISVGAEGFQHILSHMVPGIAQSPAISRLFKALDQNNDNKLDFREMICGLSILAKGSLDEKLELLFRSFDVDNTGFITRAQLESLITSVSSQMDHGADKHSSEVGVVGLDPLGGRVVSVSEFVGQIFAQLNITSGRLSLEQFHQAVVAEPRLIECLMIGEDKEEAPMHIPAIEEMELRSSTQSPTASAKNIHTITDDSNYHNHSTSSLHTHNHHSNSTQSTSVGAATAALPFAVTEASNNTPLLSDTDDMVNSNDKHSYSEHSSPSKKKQCPCCVLL